MPSSSRALGDKPGGPAARRRRQLRTEARPAPFDRLDHTQRDAYLQILQHISAALPPLESHDRHEDTSSIRLPWLSMDRQSRLVFLSGARGTGKTTLLLSIAHDIHAARLRRLADPARHGDADVQQIQQAWTQAKDYLSELGSRIVWMEHLDMEPMTDSENMLAAILARIEDAVTVHFGGMDEPGETSRRPALLSPSPEFHKGLLKLKKLQADVGMAWDGNLSARAGRLDPDAYALEVMRAENARLRLNQRLTEALDAIANRIPRNSDIDEPLFVLSIDDFDINPAICLPLLRLLRLISVPRLFIIVLGDIEIATVMLNLKVSGDVGQVVSPVTGKENSEMLSIPPTDIGGVCGEIAFNALRKLVPPSQRISLDRLNQERSLDFQPLGSTENRTLKDLLSEVDIRFLMLRPRASQPARRRDLDGTHEEQREPPDAGSPSSPSNEDASGRPAFGDSAGASSTVDEHERVCGRSIRHLADFILFERLSLLPSGDDEQLREGDGKSASVGSDIPYPALDALSGSMRSATDMWHQLNTLIPQRNKTETQIEYDTSWERFKKVMRFFAKFCHDALSEDSALAALERRKLPAAMGLNPAGLANFDLLPLSLKAETYGERRLLCSHSNYEKQEVFGHLRCRLSRGFVFRVLGGRNDSPRASLRAISSAALILYHDLLVLSEYHADAGESRFSPRIYLHMLTNEPARRRVGSSETIESYDSNGSSPRLHQDPRMLGERHPPGHPWAFITWRVGRENDPVRVSWPLPPWRSFWEFYIFLDAWNGIVRRDEVRPLADYLIPEDSRIEWLAFFWITGATAILTGNAAPDEKDFAKDTNKFEAPVSEELWEKTFESVAKALAENSRETSRGRRLRDWANRLALFTLPELGLGLEARKRIVQAARIERSTLDNHGKEDTVGALKLWEKERYFLSAFRNEIRAPIIRHFPQFRFIFDSCSDFPEEMDPIFHYNHNEDPKRASGGDAGASDGPASGASA